MFDDQLKPANDGPKAILILVIAAAAIGGLWWAAYNLPKLKFGTPDYKEINVHGDLRQEEAAQDKDSQ